MLRIYIKHAPCDTHKCGLFWWFTVAQKVKDLRRSLIHCRKRGFFMSEFLIRLRLTTYGILLE